jgi:sporulation protein YlmC with PRC-barrel domain
MGQIPKIGIMIMAGAIFPIFWIVGAGAEMVTADHLRGYVVRGADDSRVGKIDGVLIDLEQGRIRYLLVISSGDEPRKVIVPWRAARVQTQPPSVRLSISAEKFLQAPSGEKALDDREEGRAIHHFFGVAPYWEDKPSTAQPRPPRNLRIVR